MGNRWQVALVFCALIVLAPQTCYLQKTTLNDLNKLVQKPYYDNVNGCSTPHLPSFFTPGMVYVSFDSFNAYRYIFEGACNRHDECFMQTYLDVPVKDLAQTLIDVRQTQTSLHGKLDYESGDMSKDNLNRGMCAIRTLLYQERFEEYGLSPKAAQAALKLWSGSCDSYKASPVRNHFRFCQTQFYKDMLQKCLTMEPGAQEECAENADIYFNATYISHVYAQYYLPSIFEQAHYVASFIPKLRAFMHQKRKSVLTRAEKSVVDFTLEKIKSQSQACKYLKNEKDFIDDTLAQECLNIKTFLEELQTLPLQGLAYAN